MKTRPSSEKTPKLTAITAPLIAIACGALASPALAFASESSSAASAAQLANTDQLREYVLSELPALYQQAEALVNELNVALTECASQLSILLTIVGFCGAFITAVLVEWLFRRQTAGAAKMIRERTGATIGSGVIGAIAIPLLVVLLSCLGVTLPVAGSLAFAALSLSTAATGFMGASLFKLAFKNMGRYKCALLGGVIMGVAGVIPYLGIVVQVAAFIYLLGYVLQSIRQNMKDPSSTPEVSATEEEGSDSEAASGIEASDVVEESSDTEQADTPQDASTSDSEQTDAPEDAGTSDAEQSEKEG